MIKEGKVCRKCGQFYTGRQCKPCRNLREQAYRAKNPDKAAQASRRWRETNPDAYRASIEKHRAKYPQRIAASKAKWRIANRDRVLEAKRSWHARNAERINAKRRAEYQANPMKFLPGLKASYLRNRATRIASQMRWAQANREKVREIKRKWYLKNKSAWVVYGQNRRARQKLIAGCLSPGLRTKLFRLQKGRCACCGKPLGSNPHLDHIVPLALGGHNIDANVQLLRAVCNLSKGAKDPIVFMQQRGKLL